MSDALRLPPRPDLDQYRKLAKDLQRAARASEPDAIARWARRWLDALARLRGDAAPADAADPGAAIEREAVQLARRWDEFLKTVRRRGAPTDSGLTPQLTDAQFFLARAHGFASWPAFAAHLAALQDEATPTAHFEAAVDAIVAGDAGTLQRLLHAHPELARARSTREHRSTLLHYVSANGVEDFRQVTPQNIVEMTELLLAAGADVNAVSDAYGGGSTTLGLTATSMHPEQAGVQIALLETLLRHGARVDGEQAGNRHGIVLGCLANGQPRAARFFADRGAPLSLVEAAGVGRLDRVGQFFDGDERPSQDALDSALQYAAGYGHAGVIELLLQHGANPAMADDAGQTPLHWATFGPHVEVTRALLAAGAPVTARDRRFNATPLDWMVHAWANSASASERDRGREVAALLVRAGATPDLDRFGPQIATRVRSDAAMMRALGLSPAGQPPQEAELPGASVVVQLEITTPELNLCTVSPDGRRAIVAASDQPVAVWDAQTGRKLLALDADTTNAWVASWTPNPLLVLVGSRDRTVGMWDLDRRERVRELRGHHGQPRAVHTNAGVTRALTGCSHRDTSVKLWDLQTGDCVRTFEGHADGVYALAFFGEARAASGSRDTTIRIWDLDTGGTLQVLSGHTYHVHGVAWSRDGRRLLSCSMDLRMWDIDSGRCVRVFSGHSLVIRSAVWSPDERLALTASHDGTARLWDVDSGRCVRQFEGHETGLVSASFSADGRRVFTCDWLGGIRQWDAG
jgi:ankyrin repeat protein